MDVKFSEISKRYKENVVLQDVSLFLPSGSFNVLRGSNGCGKTTLLEIIAGSLKQDSGDIYFGSKVVSKLPPFDRKTFYIPQSLHKYWHLLDQRLYCYIPEMSVKDNLTAAMETSGQIGEIEDLLYLFNLDKHNDKTPDHLSFGLQQRLAIARAFLTRPNIILLDEPLSASDENQKPILLDIINKAHKAFNTTILYITHNKEEADSFDAYHYILDGGRIKKYDKAENLIANNQQRAKKKDWSLIEFRAIDDYRAEMEYTGKSYKNRYSTMGRIAPKGLYKFESKYLERGFRAPLFVSWDITHQCNGKCLYCYSDSGKNVNTKTEFTTMEILKVVEELSEIGVRVLTLSGGEPMMRKDWGKIAVFARQKGLSVNLQTNGLLINSENADLIMNSEINSVAVTLNSHIPLIHDKISNLKGSFWKVIRAIILLIDRGVRVVINYTPTSLNKDHGLEIVELAKTLGVKAVNLSSYIPIGRSDKSYDISPDDRRKILDEWIVAKEENKGGIDLIWHDCRVSQLESNEEKRDYFGCVAGWFTAGILPDGKVTPCIYLPIPIGSLRDHSFSEIWSKSELLKDFRKRERNSKGNCGECVNLYECGGCRAAAYAKSKRDVFAGDTNCWIKTINGQMTPGAAKKAIENSIFKLT
jgi:radical SAM protein with 4Fe4S-binding SPASM domain